jgi:hypothetical protein
MKSAAGPGTNTLLHEEVAPSHVSRFAGSAIFAPSTMNP